MPHPHPRTLIRIVATALLLLWGGFWLWFAGASILSEFDPATLATPLLRFVLPLILLVALGIAAPRPGGILLIAASVYAAVYYDNTSARLLLALPAFLAGAALAIAGRGGPRPAPAAAAPL
jgi:hypothetical protein